MDACCRVGGLARDDGSRNFSRILTGNGMASDKERPARVAERGWKRPPSFAYPLPCTYATVTTCADDRVNDSIFGCYLSSTYDDNRP